MLQRSTSIIAKCAVIVVLSSCNSATDTNSASPSITGRIECTETRIASVIPGRVQDVFVREGEAVTVGQKLIALDDSAFRKQRAWLDKIIEKSDIEQMRTEKLLTIMQTATTKARAFGAIKLSTAGKASGRTARQKNAPGLVPGVASRGLSKTSAALGPSDQSIDQMARQTTEFTEQQLKDMARKRADQTQRLEQLTQEAEAEVDESYAQQKKLLEEARQTENKALSKLPFKLMGKAKDSTVDELFNVKEKELEKLHELQKQSITETTKLNKWALGEGFELQRESIESLRRGCELITRQLRQEKQKADDMIAAKQNELSARLSQYGDPDFMDKTLHSLQSAQADQKSLMSDLSAEQLKGRLAFIDAEQTKARAQREEINGKIESCSITSPVAGICVSRAVQPGELVVPGPTLIKVADVRSAYFRAFVPARQLSTLKIGQKAEIHIDADDNTGLPATVTEIDNQAAFSPQNLYGDDKWQQQYGITLTLDHADAMVKPGLSGHAIISPATHNVQ